MKKVTVYVDSDKLAENIISLDSVRVFVSDITEEEAISILSEGADIISEANEPFYWKDRPPCFHLANWFFVGDQK
jgi:hypothetical protein